MSHENALLSRECKDIKVELSHTCTTICAFTYLTYYYLLGTLWVHSCTCTCVCDLTWFDSRAHYDIHFVHTCKHSPQHIKEILAQYTFTVDFSLMWKWGGVKSFDVAAGSIDIHIHVHVHSQYPWFVKDATYASNPKTKSQRSHPSARLGTPLFINCRGTPLVYSVHVCTTQA